MITDYYYQNILRQIHEEGDLIETRNYLCKSCFDLDPITFTKTPLVTIRKTAWKKALRELEWFMSGDKTCPEELLDWWKGQLDEHGHYHRGYSEQLRYSRMPPHYGSGFDQIKYILMGLRNNPNSRRLVMTTWNPWDMDNMILLNNNPNTPTTCHLTLINYFVRDRQLHVYHYQRSADILLGLPHNFIQHWALLLYFAKHSNLEVGSLRYQIGDGHIYQHESHIEATRQLIRCDTRIELDNSFKLCYNSSVEQGEYVPVFKADDFVMEGVIPDPIVTIRPVLL
jgi:thymidylate synthase